MWGPFDATRDADLRVLDGGEGRTGYGSSIQWHQLLQSATKIREEDETLRTFIVETIDFI